MRSLHRLPASASLLLALSSALPAQNAELRSVGGTLGTKLENTLSGGGANKAYVSLISFQRGAFPLAAIDAADTRFVRVGLELAGLILVGALDGQGGAKFDLPLPNDANLAGFALLQQSLTLPGANTTFHEGFIESETQRELVIRQAGGTSRTFSASSLDQRVEGDLSLMPTGLQQLMSLDDLVDLVEYLASLKGE